MSLAESAVRYPPQTSAARMGQQTTAVPARAPLTSGAKMGAHFRLTDMTRDENHDIWTWKVQDNPIRKFRDSLQEIVTGIAHGAIKQTFMFVGPPGFGKTATFRQVCRQHNRVPKEIKSASPEGLAEALEVCALTNTIAYLDDANDILRNKASCQLLMTATLPQNKGEHRVWTKPLANGRSKQYCYDKLVIVIMGNKYRDELLRDGGDEMRALLTRVQYVECRSSRQEEFEYTCYMAIVGEYLKPLGHSIEVINTALTYMAQNVDYLPDVSLRALEELVILIVSAPKSWRSLVTRDTEERKSISIDVMPEIIPAPRRDRRPKRVPEAARC